MDKNCLPIVLSVAIVGEGMVPLAIESQQHGLPYSDIELTHPSTGQQAANWPVAANVTAMPAITSMLTLPQRTR